MVKYLNIDSLSAYKKAFRLSNKVWNMVSKWGWFDKRTVGAQLVNAADSISANIAEGFGRHYKKDKVKFYHIARGSVVEVIDWVEKIKLRRLISLSDYRDIIDKISELPKEINQLIKYTNRKLKQ